jgi:PAS domain S-box-containing protein
MDTQILNNSKVLVIDDDDRNIFLLQQILQKKGIQVKSETNADNALVSARSYFPDLILLDVMMPGTSGFDICRKLKKEPELCDIPVVFLSSFGEMENKLEGFRSGGLDFIHRPFERDELIARVTTQLKSRKAELQIQQTNNLLTNFIQKSITGTLIIDSNGKILIWNKALEQITGYDNESVINRYLWDVATEIIGISSDSYSNAIRNWVFASFENDKGAPILNEEKYLNRNNKLTITENLSYVIETENGKNLVILVKDITESRLNKEALDESEEVFRLLLTNLTDLVLVLQEEEIVYINDKVSDLLGYNKDELIGRNLFALLPEETRRLAIFHYEERKLTRNILEFDTNLRTKSGQEKIVKVKLFDAVFKGLPSSMVVISDITELKRNEDKLKKQIEEIQLKNEQINSVNLELRAFSSALDIQKQKLFSSQGRLRSILDNINASIHVSDLKTNKILFINKFGKDVYGNVEGQVCWDVFQKGRSNQCANCLSLELFKSDGTPNGAHEFEIWDASTGKWHLCSTSGIEWIDGKKVRLEIKYDITERKTAEIAVKESETKFKTLVNVSPDGIGSIDLNGNFDYVSDTLMRIFQYTNPLELKTKNILDFIQPQDREKALAQIKLVLKTKEAVIETYLAKRKDGSQIYIEVNVSVILTGNRRPERIMFIARDITLQIQKQLEIDKKNLFIKSIFNSSPDAIIVHNMKGIITECNEAALHLLQIKDKEDLLSDNFYHFFQEKEKHKILLDHSMVPESGTVKNKEYKISTYLGVDYFVEISTSNISHPLDDELNLISIIKDISDRKNAQNTLETQLNFISTLIQSIPHPIYYKDVLGRYLGYNKAFSEYYGYAQEAIEGKTVVDMSPDHAGHEFHASDLMLLAKGGIEQVEFNALNKGLGMPQDYILTKATFTDQNKKVAGLVGIMTNITEQKKLENQLREKEKMYRLLAENQNDVVWMTDFNLNPIYTSPSIYKFQGYTVEEFEKVPAEKSLIPESLETARNALTEAFENLKIGKMNAIDQLRVMELQYYKKDGTIIWGEVSASFSLNGKGNINGIQGVTRDITERKLVEQKIIELNAGLEQKVMERTQQLEEVNLDLMHEISTRMLAENALSESERKFRKLFENSNDPIFIIDIKGVVLEVNFQACELLHYKDKNLLIGLKAYKMVTQPNRAMLFKRGHFFHNEVRKIIELEVVAKNGEIIPVEIHNKEIEYNGKRAILINARDIRERRQIQQKVLKAVIESEEKQRIQFSKDIHDGMGALLSSVNIYLTLMEKSRNNAEEFNDMVKTAKSLLAESAQTARDISNNLKPSILTNFGLVKSIEEYILKLNRAGGIHLVFTHSGLSMKPSSDIEDVLYRIVNELITNTIKHAEAKLIKIDLRNDRSRYYLQYEDDGKGFEAVETEKKHKGMGLNNIPSRLSTVNGNIEIKTKIGEGFKAFIEIPVPANIEQYFAETIH